MKQILGETMEESKENFDEWREAFESKKKRVNLGKTKLTGEWDGGILVACVKQQ